MRIILLTILFLAPLYYFRQDSEVSEEAPEQDDQVKIKQGAPERAQNLRATEKNIPLSESPQSSDSALDLAEVEKSIEESIEEGQLDDNPHLQWTELEEGWNTELKNMLTGLEPADGEEIYKNYMKAQESYQAELDNLMSEKQQKTSKEAVSEIDQLISQLEEKHQETLKEILGAHYEAVRDQYQHYMDSLEE